MLEICSNLSEQPSIELALKQCKFKENEATERRDFASMHGFPLKRHQKQLAEIKANKLC